MSQPISAFPETGARQILPTLQGFSNPRLDSWDLIVKYQLQSFVLPAIQDIEVAAGGSGEKANAYLPISTNPQTALDVYALHEQVNFRADNNGNPSVAGNDVLGGQGFYVPTYTQPTPPAANNTTDAATTGILGTRNHFDNLYCNCQTDLAILTAASSYTETQAKTFDFYKVFNRPRRIVGAQLEHFFYIQATTTGVRLNAYLVIYGKYVSINLQEYTNLVALATGSAILPPTIL